MQFYPKSYLAKTRRLSCLEHGAFCQLLFLMWEAGGSLPYDFEFLAAETGLEMRDFAEVFANLENLFFVRRGRLYNQRIIDDMKEKGALSNKRKNAANSRWVKNDNKNNNFQHANALQNDANKEPEPELKPKPNFVETNEKSASDFKTKPSRLSDFTFPSSQANHPRFADMADNKTQTTIIIEPKDITRNQKQN